MRTGGLAPRRARSGRRAAIPVLVVAFVAAGCSSGSKPAAGGSHPATTVNTALATSGNPGEGPYPWKYPASGTVQVGSGTTTAGNPCAAAGGQLPGSIYSAPCVAKFTGDNGGATSNGVTATQILLANRVFPSTANSQQVAAVAKSDGIALPQVTDQVMQTFLDYFNQTYELYGRKVVIQDVPATGNATSEALNQGQAQACADADKIANQVHAFAELGIGRNLTGGGGSGPFSVCAAQQKLVELLGGAYFPESFYQQNNPYVWHILQDCERIAHNSAEAFGKELVGKPAIYAGDASLKSAPARKFGTYIPNLPAYADCENVFKQDLINLYHASSDAVSTEFTYNLDISTFQTSAQQAIVQFKAAGVTTIVTACDPFSLSLLTNAAVAQNYHPEWLLNGAAGNDTDNFAQAFNQTEVKGHLFGLSEAPPTVKLRGPQSEPGLLYQKLTGHPIPDGTDGNYYILVNIFNMLQAAGPTLTPDNMARGTHALPVLGGPNGFWNYNAGPSGNPASGDHTAGADARFVYWNATATSPLNNKVGTYDEAFDGKRYAIGQWPADVPPLFPASCNCS